MDKPYTQKELKEEWLRRHYSDIETVPIYCVDGKFVTEKPEGWMDRWWVGLVICCFIFIDAWVGYDMGYERGIHEKCQVEQTHE